MRTVNSSESESLNRGALESRLASWGRRLPLVGLLAASITWGDVAKAADPELLLRAASEQIASAATEANAIETALAKRGRAERGPQQRIAEATLLMGVNDYDRAADVLNQVIQPYREAPTASPNAAAPKPASPDAVYADALNLLGETYFASKQYLSAQQEFLRIVKAADDPRFARYRDRAAIRIVDAALRLGKPLATEGEPSALDNLFDLLSRSSEEPSSGLAYARGKGLLAQGKLDAAEASLRRVAADSPLVHQARYLEALATMQRASAVVEASVEPLGLGKLREQYQASVARFLEVTKLSRDTEQHRHVIDLAWLAVARIQYETSQFVEAAESYNHVERTSPEFGTMLFELAWVYVKVGDFTRAQRALEVLAVAAPNSQDVADASLLRADLMLRAGQFDRSRKVYVSVRASYDTLRDRVARFMAAKKDPAVYFELLNSDHLELFESDSGLPTLALKWAREGEDGETAASVTDDVALSRRLLKESEEMIERLNAVLQSPNKIRALPDLRRNYERGLGLANAVALARMKVASGLDAIDDVAGVGELRLARGRRKALEPRLGRVPVTPSEFARRDAQAKSQWNKASQELKRLELQVDTLQATVNGLERVIADGPSQGVVRSPQEQSSLRVGLEEQKRLILQYREAASGLRKVVEAAKLQVGFLDKRFQEDKQVRRQYAVELQKELQATSRFGGRVDADLTEYARRAAEVLKRADQAESKIEAALSRLDQLVNKQVDDLREKVREETKLIVGYQGGLEALDKDARVLVGDVAMRNFSAVRDRLRNIVLRADVGITDVAWEKREAQVTRVRRLKVEKARTESRLQEELDEVLDDSGDGDKEQIDGQ